jgi:hypothetical protein
MQYVEVLVERDERLSIPKIVPAWVVPVLGIIHSEEKVQVVREHVEIEREPVDAQMEFARLEQCYGPKEGAPYVAQIYGNGPLGIKQLQRAIDEASAAPQSDDEDPTA